MVAAARARGIDARIMPGQNLTFDGEFDAVFSNAALHWMRPPEGRPRRRPPGAQAGGRFVGEMGGHNNTAAIIVALSAVLARRGLDAHRVNPWYFPSAAAYRSKLEEAGFAVADIRIVATPDGAADFDRGVAGHFRRRFLRRAAGGRTDHPPAPRWPSCCGRS